MPKPDEIFCVAKQTKINQQMEIINAKLLKNQQDLEQLNWFEITGQGVISRYYFIFFPLLLKVFLKPTLSSSGVIYFLVDSNNPALLG